MSELWGDIHFRGLGLHASEGSSRSGRSNVADPFAFPLETRGRQKRKRKTSAAAGKLPPAPLAAGVCGSTHLAAKRALVTWVPMRVP